MGSPEQERNLTMTAAGTYLVLWSQHNETGDSLPVKVPEVEGCVELDAPFSSLSADNQSTKFNAELSLTSDCSGDPVEIVAKSHRKNFKNAHNVSSVNFVQP